jgi:cyclase
VSAGFRRLVVCLDVDGGRVVKGVRFKGLRDVGDPAELAVRYEAEGADEIVFLDVSATAEGRAALLDCARRTAEGLFVPLTVGGGVRTLADADLALRAGADKVAVNSAAVARPALLGEIAERLGSQCVVLSVDARREDPSAEIPSGFRVVTHGGRTATSLDAVAWSIAGVDRGAGEVLLTSIDRDGARSGYDLDLVRAVAREVKVPVVASGGAGEGAHLAAAIEAGADAALVAGILHDGSTTIAALKGAMAAAGIPVRPGAP